MDSIEIKVGDYTVTFTSQSVSYGGKEYFYGLMSDISAVNSPFLGYQFTYEGQPEILYYNIKDEKIVSNIFDQISRTVTTPPDPVQSADDTAPPLLVDELPLDPEAIAAIPAQEIPKNKKTSGIMVNKKVIISVCVIIVIILVAVGAVLIKNAISNHSSNSDSATTSSKSNASLDLEKIYKSGKYQVGTDMPAGEYLIQGNGYLVVSTDSSDNLDSIVTNGNYSNRTYIQVKDGQYFEFEGHAQLAEYAPEYKGANPLPDGMYKVGKDIPAGKYTLKAKGDAYVAIMSNSLGLIDSISDNKNFKKTFTVTVSDGQYIKLLNCTLKM